eukprot:TRINITY_DN9141_c0_g3_i1.p1 TRINITY_DN9141_c0_g3~~TRINITY_DN9141_c0_g3_i1.p1  ORF type:complete len:211 (+),score=68.66 TRINITY_DN9141_c0_g3_i1:176-808(+)
MSVVQTKKNTKVYEEFGACVLFAGTVDVGHVRRMRISIRVSHKRKHSKPLFVDVQSVGNLPCVTTVHKPSKLVPGSNHIIDVLVHPEENGEWFGNIMITNTDNKSNMYVPIYIRGNDTTMTTQKKLSSVSLNEDELLLTRDADKHERAAKKHNELVKGAQGIISPRFKKSRALNNDHLESSARKLSMYRVAANLQMSSKAGKQWMSKIGK